MADQDSNDTLVGRTCPAFADAPPKDGFAMELCRLRNGPMASSNLTRRCCSECASEYDCPFQAEVDLIRKLVTGMSDVCPACEQSDTVTPKEKDIDADTRHNDM